MKAETILPRAVPRSAQAAAADELFEAAYVLHRETVFRFLRGRCPVEDDALDLTAFTFERALRASRTGQLPERVLPWLLRTARNAAIDRQRRSRTRSLLLGVLGRSPAATARSAEQEVLAREPDEGLRAALASLPSDQRDALALRYGADLTIRDVASLLGKGEAATQKLISRGLTRLKEIHP